MPPPTKRDCQLVLFDVHSSKKQSLLKGLLKISVYKWLSHLKTNKKDLHRLVLTHTKKTNNELNYPNINVTEVEDFKPKDVYDNIINAKSAEGNWLDDILIGIHYLKQAVSLPGLVTMQLIYFTTLDSNLESPEEATIQKIIEELKENKIYIYIIGPNVELSSTITCADDVPKAMHQLTVEKSNRSLTIAKRIVENITTGVLCDLNVGINLLYSFKDYGGSQPWLVPLSFGSELSLPVETTKTYRKDNFCKFNRHTNKTMVLVDDTTAQVNFQDIVHGVLRHGKFVPVEDSNMFKVDADRSFDVLGFTEQKFVPDLYLTGFESYYFVLPNKESGAAYELFCYLLKILSEQNMYAIARQIYYKNCKPKFYALIPQPNVNLPHFLMALLPYADDTSRQFVLEDPKPFKEKIEDTEFVQFCEQLDINSAQRKISVPLGPAMTIDWLTDRLINKEANKVFHTTFEFAETELDPFDVHETSQVLEKLKESWPLYRDDNDDLK